MANEAGTGPMEQMDQKTQNQAADDAESENKRKGESWSENIKTIVYALLIALVIRTLLFQPFHIPSGSMEPSLLTGDYIFASKYTYGYSRHSMPFSPPLFEGRFLGRDPERGEIAVFKTPEDNRTDFIKRVIGLPGDTIQMQGGVLHINGDPVPRELVNVLEETNRFGGITTTQVYRETLPNGVEYLTYDMGPREYDNTRVYFVPAGHYFMMGDNRDNSSDSRVFGAVSEEAFVGKAQIVFFSVNQNFRLVRPWTWFNFRLDRFFHGLKADPEKL